MPSTKYGEQPAYAALRRQRWTFSAAARELGVDRDHLANAVRGCIRPRPEVRAGLPKLLGLPLKKCFTAEVLAKPYDAKRNPWRPL